MEPLQIREARQVRPRPADSRQLAVDRSSDASDNRNWQAINVRTPAEAFCQMATNVATGLEITGEDHIRPVTWEERITLPIRPRRTRPCTRCAALSACRP